MISFARAAIVALALTGLAAESRAQGQVQLQVQSRLDSGPLKGRPDGAMLSPMVLTYIATLQYPGGDARQLGERAVQLSKSIYAGLSAWEMVETHGAGSNASVDTVVVDFQSLSPFHWGATQQIPGNISSASAARVSAEFRADSVIGILSAPSGRRTIIAPVPRAAYLTAAHLETSLRVLPVNAGWRDSIALVVSDLGKTSVIRGELVVSGQEEIVTGAGNFDCWIVDLTTPVGRSQYWVSKLDRFVVKTSQVVPETGESLVYMLSSILR